MLKNTQTQKTLATLVVWDFENIKNRNPKMQLDLKKQKLLIDRGRGTNVTHVAFIGDFSKNSSSGFTEKLERLGFTVKTKKPKKGISKDGSSFLEADMDAEIVHFMLTEFEFFSTVVIVSGDGDMFPTLSTIKKSNRNVEVFSLKGRLSRKLNVFKTEYLTGFKNER